MIDLRFALVFLTAATLAPAAGSAVAAADLAAMRDSAVFDGAKPHGTRYAGRRDGVAFIHNPGGAPAVAIVADDPDTGPDQLAVFSGWYIACYHDAMADEISCSISRTLLGEHGADPATVFVTDGSYVCVYANDFPGLLAMVRVDAYPPETVDANRCLAPDAAERVISQLLIHGGKNLRTRYHAWPYEEARDVELETTGLGVAFELLAWLRANAAAPGPS
jgi:hypothetical protein